MTLKTLVLLYRGRGHYVKMMLDMSKYNEENVKLTSGLYIEDSCATGM